MSTDPDYLTDPLVLKTVRELRKAGLKTNAEIWEAFRLILLATKPKR